MVRNVYYKILLWKKIKKLQNRCQTYNTPFLRWELEKDYCFTLQTCDNISSSRLDAICEKTFQKLFSTFPRLGHHFISTGPGIKGITRFSYKSHVTGTCREYDMLMARHLRWTLIFMCLDVWAVCHLTLYFAILILFDKWKH